MCAGQQLDMDCAALEQTEANARLIHSLKTAAPLRAAAAAGCVLAGAGQEEIQWAEAYAAAFGAAFQIRDDILNNIGREGKDSGNDAAAGKLTFPAVLDEETCAARLAEHTEQAAACLEHFSGGDFLAWFTRSVLSQ
jgi:geranylgeranyl pyrophosphate synthase